MSGWEGPAVVAAVQLDRTACGYVCKRCGGPAPVGVGYAAPGSEAAAASEGLTRCACGYSVHADVLEEGGQR